MLRQKLGTDFNQPLKARDLLFARNRVVGTSVEDSGYLEAGAFVQTVVKAESKQTVKRRRPSAAAPVMRNSQIAMI